ncbi:hypothetical protein JVT61DRAFT_10336 [Boletus reticuloceps]|uniref:Uncharacterized protein n=1 Tax=Boletus reticuloceps TaxID=495285 RepID=A0A8I3AET3_9AGAM|nr:hypothetical protein JVT61DRAFT_10336 [Boletus reticuloceps]
MHLLALPGHGTEVTQWQYTNSSASPQHLFLSSTLGTLVTHSSYNKTTSITGQYKHLLLVIPFSLSVIIIKLLRIVRPIETFTYTSLSVGDTSDNQTAYATYMFVSLGGIWESKILSACLRHWFTQELQVPFGLRLHRHFAQTLQHQFLSYTDDSKLLMVANEVLGHGQEVAGLHYARDAIISSALPTFT